VDKGEGEVRPLEMPRNQAGMARVIFDEQERGRVGRWHIGLLDAVMEEARPVRPARGTEPEDSTP